VVFAQTASFAFSSKIQTTALEPTKRLIQSLRAGYSILNPSNCQPGSRAFSPSPYWRSTGSFTLSHGLEVSASNIPSNGLPTTPIFALKASPGLDATGIPPTESLMISANIGSPVIEPSVLNPLSRALVPTAWQVPSDSIISAELIESKRLRVSSVLRATDEIQRTKFPLVSFRFEASGINGPAFADTHQLAGTVAADSITVDISRENAQTRLIGGTTSLGWSSHCPWTLSFDASGIFAGTQSSFGSPGLKSTGSCILSPGFDRSAIGIASAVVSISNALKSSYEFEATIVENSITVNPSTGLGPTASITGSTLLQPSYQTISCAFTPTDISDSGFESSVNFPGTRSAAASALFNPTRSYKSSSDLGISAICIASAVVLISNVFNATTGNALTAVIFATDATTESGLYSNTHAIDATSSLRLTDRFIWTGIADSVAFDKSQGAGPTLIRVTTDRFVTSIGSAASDPLVTVYVRPSESFIRSGSAASVQFELTNAFHIPAMHSGHFSSSAFIETECFTGSVHLEAAVASETGRTSKLIFATVGALAALLLLALLGLLMLILAKRRKDQKAMADGMYYETEGHVLDLGESDPELSVDEWDADAFECAISDTFEAPSQLSPLDAGSMQQLFQSDVDEIF
jgi:hypothetical protein